MGDGLADRERLLALLKLHGWNATSFQLLEEGFELWFDPSGGCVAYVDTGGAWVVGGAPVAEERQLGGVAARFSAEAKRQGKRVAFFAVERRFLESIAMPSIHVGEQPWWNPQLWRDGLASSRSLREQLRRARAKGVRVERVEPDAASGALRDEIEQLISRWLRTRVMPPMAFLVALRPFVFASERRYYVARRGERLIGLLVAVPIYRRNGWFFENVLRDPASPNGTAEAMVDYAMREVAEGGVEYVTLGLAPLAGDERWLRVTRRVMRGFYNFDGLLAFKKKLRPNGMDPIFVAYPPERAAAAAIADSLSAFARGRPAQFASRALLRAPSQLLATLGILLGPWLVLLATVDARWFPNEIVRWSWIAFDVAMAAALLMLARRWRRRLGLATAIAAAGDFALTSLQAIAWNLPRMKRRSDVAVIAISVAAPLFAATVLGGGVKRHRTED